MLVILSKASAMVTIIGLLCLASVPSVHAADFSLTFSQPLIGGTFPGSCNTGTGAGGMCETAGAAQELDPDMTPFTQRSVAIDGITYWHQIIGDPDEGFAMEVYIQQSGFLISDSGGRPSNFPLPGVLYRKDLDVQSGNGWDPLGLDPSRGSNFTGNGTADPTRVVMRQVLGGSWNETTSTWSCGAAEFCMDFTKAALETKPRIMQLVNDASEGFTAFFDLDMSNISYDDNTTAGTLINTVTLPELVDVPVISTTPITSNGNGGNVNNGGRFSMESDTQRSTVTGGRYTYTDGSGWVNNGTADGYQTWEFNEGRYDYFDGGFDQLGQTWGSYFDATQNAFPGNESKCDSGVLTGSCP
ncbi:MAG: hypothetical protein L3J89_11045 [Gammaproteobacteria bacterium]|nr:hypothetical protein [Gammaproteobacteria bacterium]